MTERLSDYIGQYAAGRKSTSESNRVSEESIKLFVNRYLGVVDSTRLGNDEHPLIYVVRNQNRLYPQVSPFLDGIKHYERTGEPGKISNGFDYDGWVGECVSRPLDYADDYNIGPYHYRARTLREEFTLPLHALRYKLRTCKTETQKVQSLSSFYLQSAKYLYESTDGFMYMAAADVFHKRGEQYFEFTTRLLWEDCARMNGYDISGNHYPDGKFELTPEYRNFINPLFSAANWINRYASERWKQFSLNTQVPRERVISEAVSEDRMEWYNYWANTRRNEGIVSKVSDYQGASTVLSRIGVII